MEYYHFEHQGTRNSMQDRIQIGKQDGESLSCVFDGHGKSNDVVDFVSSEFAKIFFYIRENFSDLKIETVFEMTFNAIQTNIESLYLNGGSTTTSVFVDNLGNIYYGFIGDSVFYLIDSHGKLIKPVKYYHEVKNMSNNGELERLQSYYSENILNLFKSTGYIFCSSRSQLNMTRAFGNHSANSGISKIPFVGSLGNKIHGLVLTTDGVNSKEFMNLMNNITGDIITRSRSVATIIKSELDMNRFTEGCDASDFDNVTILAVDLNKKNQTVTKIT